MGLAHFQQMYEDAMEVDQAAAVTVMSMLPRVGCPAHSSAGFWADCPAHRLFQVARATRFLQDDMLEDLKQLVARGRSHVRVIHPHTGQVLFLKDDRLLDEPDPRLPEGLFNSLVWGGNE